MSAGRRNVARWYCPLSGRFAADEPDLWSADDVRAASCEPRSQSQPETNDLAAGVVKSWFPHTTIQPNPDASDAVMAAFDLARVTSAGERRCVVVTRRPVPPHTRFRIERALELAQSIPAHSGVLNYRTQQVEGGLHVVVLLERSPRCRLGEGVDEARMLALVERSRRQLAAAADAGIIHGGINERWLDVEGGDKPLSGFGLQAIYDVWRRATVGQLGLLEGDPRFAPAALLAGHPAAADTDQETLTRVLGTVWRQCGDSNKEPGPEALPVQGWEAFATRSELVDEDWIGFGDDGVRERLRESFAPHPAARGGSARAHVMWRYLWAVGAVLMLGVQVALVVMVANLQPRPSQPPQTAKDASAPIGSTEKKTSAALTEELPALKLEIEEKIRTAVAGLSSLGKLETALTALGKDVRCQAHKQYQAALERLLGNETTPLYGRLDSKPAVLISGDHNSVKGRPAVAAALAVMCGPGSSLLVNKLPLSSGTWADFVETVKPVNEANSALKTGANGTATDLKPGDSLVTCTLDDCSP